MAGGVWGTSRKRQAAPLPPSAWLSKGSLAEGKEEEGKRKKNQGKIAE
jgi:hypothetical protein